MDDLCEDPELHAKIVRAILLMLLPLSPVCHALMFVASIVGIPLGLAFLVLVLFSMTTSTSLLFNFEAVKRRLREYLPKGNMGEAREAMKQTEFFQKLPEDRKQKVISFTKSSEHQTSSCASDLTLTDKFFTP